MQTDVTPQQVASYRENGFLVCPGFLDATELPQHQDIQEWTIDEVSLLIYVVVFHSY